MESRTVASSGILPRIHRSSARSERHSKAPPRTAAFEERFQTDILLVIPLGDDLRPAPKDAAARTRDSASCAPWSPTSYRNGSANRRRAAPHDIAIGLRSSIGRPSIPNTFVLLPKPFRHRTIALAHRPHTRDDLTGDEPPESASVSSEGVELMNLSDGTTLDKDFSAMGGWISSTLVRLGDLKFTYRPPDHTDDD